MYGAILEADVGKHKNKQIIEITLLMADDKYAIGGEKMTETAIKVNEKLARNQILYKK